MINVCCYRCLSELPIRPGENAAGRCDCGWPWKVTWQGVAREEAVNETALVKLVYVNPHGLRALRDPEDVCPVVLGSLERVASHQIPVFIGMSRWPIETQNFQINAASFSEHQETQATFLKMVTDDPVLWKPV